jgi:hypothetical protein
MGSRAGKLVLARDKAVFVDGQGRATEGPSLNGAEDVNDAWLAWCRHCVKQHQVREVSIELPADRCYWAVLGADFSSDLDDEDVRDAVVTRARRRGRVGSEADLFDLEAVLPVAIEEVEARFVRTRDGAVIACAVEKDRLGDMISLTETAGPQVRSIRPEGMLPDLAAFAGEVDDKLTGSLEFRSGIFEDAAGRRRRKAIPILAGVTWIAACCLVGWGLIREAQQYQAGAEDVLEARREVAASVLPLELRDDRNRDPADVLRDLVRQTAMSRDDSANAHRASDVTPELVMILSAWPEGLDAEISEWSQDGQKITIKGESESQETGEALARAIRAALPADTWRDPQSGFNRARAGRYAFTIDVNRVRETGGRS